MKLRKIAKNVWAYSPIGALIRESDLERPEGNEAKAFLVGAYVIVTLGLIEVGIARYMPNYTKDNLNQNSSQREVQPSFLENTTAAETSEQR